MSNEIIVRVNGKPVSVPEGIHGIDGYCIGRNIVFPQVGF